METDYEALTDAVAAKVWESMQVNAGILNFVPLEEQNDMVQMNLKSQVLPFVTVITPVVKAQVEAAVKNRITAVINESHEAGHDADFTLLAVSAELSEDED